MRTTDVTIYHSIDYIYFGRVIGWAFAANTDTGTPEPLAIEVWHGHMCLGRTVANRPRPDVGDAYPSFQNSKSSGFDLEFQLPNGSKETAEITFQAKPSVPDGATPSYS